MEFNSNGIKTIEIISLLKKGMERLAYVKIKLYHLCNKSILIEGFNGMLYVFSFHCYCHPVIYSLSFVYIKFCILYLVSCKLKVDQKGVVTSRSQTNMM